MPQCCVNREEFFTMLSLSIMMSLPFEDRSEVTVSSSACRESERQRRALPCVEILPWCFLSQIDTVQLYRNVTQAGIPMWEWHGWLTQYLKGIWMFLCL